MARSLLEMQEIEMQLKIFKIHLEKILFINNFLLILQLKNNEV